MTAITVEEAQGRLPEIIANLSKGDELVITQGNRVVARLVGEGGDASQRPGPGLCKGMLTIVADDDEHLKDFAEYVP